MAYQLLRRLAGEDPNLRLKFQTYLSYQAQHAKCLARGGLTGLRARRCPTQNPTGRALDEHANSCPHLEAWVSIPVVSAFS